MNRYTLNIKLSIYVIYKLNRSWWSHAPPSGTTPVEKNELTLGFSPVFSNLAQPPTFFKLLRKWSIFLSTCSGSSKSHLATNNAVYDRFNCDLCHNVWTKGCSFGCFKHLLYLSSAGCCQGTWWRVLSCLSQAWLALSQWLSWRRAFKFWWKPKESTERASQLSLRCLK